MFAQQMKAVVLLPRFLTVQTEGSRESAAIKTTVQNMNKPKTSRNYATYIFLVTRREYPWCHSQFGSAKDQLL